MALARYVQPVRFQRGPDWQLKFLQSEAGSTANLYDFVLQARIELEHFVRFGNLTASDQSFYRALQREVASFAASIDAEAARWTEQTIPSAYDIGATTHAPNVVLPRDALAALSGRSLGLIRNVTDDIRRDIRHSIAAGILTGLSGQELRARIVTSGIGRGRWPSVEYRAGVIARTETMGAYNAGARDAMEANGAQFARWIISPDEAVCPICLPLAGKVFRLKSFVDWQAEIGGPNPYPEALMLPKLPRHPRCRCTIAAVYRDRNGKVLGRSAPTEPKAPAAIEDEPAVTPPAADDFEAALTKLRRGDAADDAFWRSVEMTPERITLLAEAPVATYRGFMQSRYGIELSTSRDAADMFTSTHRFKIVNGLEKFNNFWRDRGDLGEIGIRGDLGDHPLQPGNKTPAHYKGTLFRVFHGEGKVDPATGKIASLPKGMIEFGEPSLSAVSYPPSGRSGGKAASWFDETVVHEAGHALHTTIPPDGRKEWERIHAATKAPANLSEIKRQLGDARNQVEQTRLLIGEINRRIATGESGQLVMSLGLYEETLIAYARQVSKLTEMLEEATKAKTESFPSKYAESNDHEDFADSVTMWIYDPAQLRALSPARYEFMATYFPS